MSGEGRVEEPELIIDILKNHIKKKLIFKNKSFLITAGPTFEMIDPVRFIGNFSSGKMGYELANIVIFVILQPALILLFFMLWRREKNKK